MNTWFVVNDNGDIIGRNLSKAQAIALALNMKYTYTLEIATDGEVWFTKSSIKSLQEAKRIFNAENVNDLASHSTVKIVNNCGKVVMKKSN